ncbi:transglycosylase SLT domain-containing protein [Streptomyces sp. NPDC006798]|uniref:transglycosylase SLT domain-containing protein n=1 Tax=Streptomyces sp. NPDC006798 TaxID=3155462 RepID=UPI0033D18BC2
MSVFRTQPRRGRSATRRAWAGGLTAAGTLAVTLALVPGTATAAPAAAAPAPQAAAVSYPNNLNGWILESLDVMRLNGIPGTYEGLHRNILRESSGNPLAINNWDINAINGTPSKGLLQVIDPTFRAYWVPGTPNDPFHPVANIVAAANYAADRYGSIDNVFGPY